jgi:YjbE family integral membrane protein
MELFSNVWWAALGTIILADLLLAGDNALLIGLAARKLDEVNRKKAIIIGAIGAIVIRSSMALVAVWLLTIPGLLGLAGLVLVYLGLKTMFEKHTSDDGVVAKSTLAGAVTTILIADASMGVENAITIAGVAGDSISLVIAGLVISIPIVVFGSTLVIKAIDRFPIIPKLGGLLLIVLGGAMTYKEPMLHSFIDVLLLSN